MCLYTTCTSGAQRSQRTADLDMTTELWAAWCRWRERNPDSPGGQSGILTAQSSFPSWSFWDSSLAAQVWFEFIMSWKMVFKIPLTTGCWITGAHHLHTYLCGAGDWTQGSAHFTNRASSPVPFKKFIGNLKSNLANLKLLYFQYFWNVLYSVVMNSSFCHLGRKIPLLKIRTSETWLKETPP